MDYLFYGKVNVSQQENTTSVSLQIECDANEALSLHAFTTSGNQPVTYMTLPSEQYKDHLAANFKVNSNQLFLFTIEGQSNETSILFEVTYAVYGNEVIHLPGNDIVNLKGTTYIFADGSRKTLE